MAVATLYPTNEVAIKTADGTVTWDLALREQHTVELDPVVHELDEAMPDAPILGLTSKIGAPKTVKQPIYFMMREKQFTRFINLDDTYTAGDSVLDITAADVNKVKRGYYILNTLTRVMYRVNGTPAAACPIEVVGEVADANSVYQGSGEKDELIILGYRGAELDTRFVDFVRLPDVIFNYVGEIQKAYEISQYEGASGHIPGHDPLTRLRRQKLQECRLDLEWDVLLQQKHKGLRTDADGGVRMVYTSGGADSFLTKNETDFSGTVNETKLNTASRQIRRHGPNERWGLASPQFMETLDKTYFSIGTRQLPPIPTEIGMAITRIKYGSLTINFFEHPAFDDATSTHANSLAHSCWIFNLSDLGLVTMTSDQMGFFKWFFRVETPGLRGKSDQLVVNYGVKMALPETHARWINCA